MGETTHISWAGRRFAPMPERIQLRRTKGFDLRLAGAEADAP
jgi:hypothetical protein